MFVVLCYELSAFSAQSKSENVDNVDCSDMGIDKSHDSTLVIAVRPLNCLTTEIAVLLHHIHGLGEVGGVLEKCAAAQLVQVVLPDVRDVLGAYLVQHTFSLDSSEVNVTETVSVNRLFTIILAYLDSIAECINADTGFHGVHLIQRTLDTVNDTAQAEQFAMILVAPVLAESHIRDEVRLDEVVVIINELAICLAVKVEI